MKNIQIFKKILKLKMFMFASFGILNIALAKNDENSGALLTEIGRWGLAIFFFIIFVLIGWVVAKFIASRMKKKKKYEVHKEVVLLVERSVFFTILILGAIIAFTVVGVDLTWVLGPLTIGLGFAFKDLFGNLIAGVVILSQKKFKIGDIIQVRDKLGRIIDMDVRTTEVQALNGTNFIVPNSDMLTEIVQNFTSNTVRRLTVRVGVHYSTPLAYAIQTALGAIKTHPQAVSDPAPEVLTLEFNDSSILLEVRFWVDSSLRWWALQSEMVQAVKHAFDNAGITIPFPIRTMALDPYDRNLLEAAHVKPDFNPAYSGYTADDLRPENLNQNVSSKKNSALNNMSQALSANQLKPDNQNMNVNSKK